MLTSDNVKMKTNPVYQVITSDQANKVNQDFSSYSRVSKQKPAGDVKDITNEQNFKNPSYAVSDVTVP